MLFIVTVLPCIEATVELEDVYEIAPGDYAVVLKETDDAPNVVMVFMTLLGVIVGDIGLTVNVMVAVVLA